jgi:hypothetical protein
LVTATEAEILQVVREPVPGATLRRIGPLDRLRCVAKNAGIGPAGFVVQSKETIDRDYQGSWFYAMADPHVCRLIARRDRA